MGQVCQARLRDPPASPPLNYTFKRLFGASLHYLAGTEHLRGKGITCGGKRRRKKTKTGRRGVICKIKSRRK